MKLTFPLFIALLALCPLTLGAQNDSPDTLRKVNRAGRNSGKPVAAHLRNASYKKITTFNVSPKPTLLDTKLSAFASADPMLRAYTFDENEFSSSRRKDAEADDMDETPPVLEAEIGAVARPRVRPQLRVRLAFSSTSTVPASDVSRALARKCPNVTIAFHASQSDYALEAKAATTNPVFPFAGEVTRYRFSLINRAGDTMYSTSPFKFSNAINNVCAAIRMQTRGAPPNK